MRTSRALVVLIAGIALRLLERHRPLRRTTEAEGRRDLRNLTLAAVAAVSMPAVERPIVGPLSEWVERRRVGLVLRAPLPGPLRSLMTLLLLDYSLYAWHVMTHRLPWLWRMHIVHHVDRDLSVTTALRFHVAELAVSVAWRILQVVVIGVTPRLLALWQTLTLLSVLFHHSNLRLPMEVERRLVWLIVTPRMHGIHHSMYRRETDSNWSSGLTLWDWAHGTLRLHVPQDTLTIGVPAYRSDRDTNLFSLLALPFIAQRPSWRNPDGSRRLRTESLQAADYSPTLT